MSRIETFTDQPQLTKRLEELRGLEVSSNDITVISQQPITDDYTAYDNITMINSEGSVWDKLVSFFSSGDPTDRVFNNLNLTQGEKDEHRQALEKGDILLYINNDLLLADNNANESDYNYEAGTDLNETGKYVTYGEIRQHNDESLNEPLADEEEIQQANIREEGDPNTDDLSLRDSEGEDGAIDTTYDDATMSEDDYPPLPVNEEDVQTIREKDKKLKRE